MSRLIARSVSHGINVMPRDVTLASTQWLLVFFCTPQRHVKSVIAAILLPPFKIRSVLHLAQLHVGCRCRENPCHSLFSIRKAATLLLRWMPFVPENEGKSGKTFPLYAVHKNRSCPAQTFFHSARRKNEDEIMLASKALKSQHLAHIGCQRGRPRQLPPQTNFDLPHKSARHSLHLVDQLPAANRALYLVLLPKRPCSDQPHMGVVHTIDRSLLVTIQLHQCVFNHVDQHHFDLALLRIVHIVLSNSIATNRAFTQVRALLHYSRNLKIEREMSDWRVDHGVADMTAAVYALRLLNQQRIRLHKAVWEGAKTVRTRQQD